MLRVRPPSSAVRLLDERDRGAVLAICDRDPVTNVFVSSRVRALGLEPGRLGAQMWGHGPGGRLESLCYSGANLVPVAATPDAVVALREKLVPLALVVTPNLPEAAALVDAPQAATEDEMVRQAERLLASGAKAVLMKGGHGKGAQSADLLVTATATVRFAAARIATGNTHGTGCTLAAAIAAGLAKGEDLSAAVRAAKDYVTAAIAAADHLGVGHGRGPVHHFHRWW